MNNLITELKEVIISNNVKDVKEGKSVISTYLNSFEFHPLQQEWSMMTSRGQNDLVEHLMNK